MISSASSSTIKPSFTVRKRTGVNLRNSRNLFRTPENDHHHTYSLSPKMSWTPVTQKCRNSQSHIWDWKNLATFPSIIWIRDGIYERVSNDTQATPSFNSCHTYLEILFDSVGVDGLRNDGDVLLDEEAKQYLRRRFAVFLGDVNDNSVLHHVRNRPEARK